MPALSNSFDLVDAAQTGNESLIAQQMRLALSRKKLENDMAAAAQRGAPQGQMVSGYYVKPSMGQQLMPILGQALNQFKQQALDADATELDRRAAAAAAKHIANAPGPDAPQSAKLAWAQAAKQIPGMASLGDAYLSDQLVNEPARQEARVDKRDARAEALADKKEGRESNLSYQRQRDQDRLEDREKDRVTKELIAQLARRGGGGGAGDSGSEGNVSKNWRTFQRADGTAYKHNLVTGATVELGDIGRESAGITKEKTDQNEKRTNASKALDQLDEAERLLPLATGSLGGIVRDKVYGAAGIASTGAKAAADLDVLANSIVSGIPRMAGQVSDADLKFLQKQGGDLANRELPVEARLSALKQVRRIMQRAAVGPSVAPTGKVPTIRESVESAAKQHSTPASDEDLLNKYLRK